MTSIAITAEELAQDLQNKDQPVLILDLRPIERYMQGHIPGSANALCSSSQQKQAVMSRLPGFFKIVLVDDGSGEAQQNAAMMVRFGFKAYYLKDGIKSWNKELMKSSQEPTISGDQLWDSIKKKDSDIFLLDVREPMEYSEFKIPGTINVPLGELFMSEIQNKIPKNKKIITICSHGNRSMVAQFVLAQNGIESSSLHGGMALWNQVLSDTVAVKEKELTIIQVEKIGKGCLSYIIDSSGEAVVIDPTFPLNKYQEFAQKHGLKIIKVIDTHQHADHVSAAYSLAQLMQARLYLSKKEEYQFESEKVDDGDIISVGSKQIKVMHTPGHTAGSMTYVIDDKYIFCGDILFVDGIGRPDLRDKAQEFAPILYQTLHEKLLKFATDAKIFPTHRGENTKPTENGVYYTTVEKAKTLPLLDLEKDIFIKKIISISTPRPMNYGVIIKVNRGTIPLNPMMIPDLEMGPNRCSIRAN